MSSSFKAALSAALAWDNLAKSDRAFLTEWLEQHGHSGNNSMWERIAADVRVYGVWPREGIYQEIIWYALEARRLARAVRSGDDPILREKQQQRDELLALAQKADDLAKYYRGVERYSGIAGFFQWHFLPVLSLRMFHEHEAKLLRQRAGREPQPTTFISRQTGGKGKRPRSREIGAFISLMVDHMREGCGKPHHDAVADMTNAAFPKAKVTPDEVRSVGRAPKRRRGGTLKRKRNARLHRGGLMGS